MSVPLTLLGPLEREPSHGYDLKRDYDTWFGRGKPLPYGQVTLLADYGLYHLEADRQWIDHTAARPDVLAQPVRQ